MELRADHQSKVNEKERLVKKEKNWSVKSQTSQLIHKKKRFLLECWRKKKNLIEYFREKFKMKLNQTKNLTCRSLFFCKCSCEESLEF